ncbi:MAG: hypothetical protein A2Y62_18500 [Candidatus Fischerbacteria bacterium RBG_13_37_8]|uniref:Aminotransferase class V domain-containing protein n=1 Tax=Candidatus Fischerbacteria bacterium RBG_13_37_8 TaxID=1817863 RepID=A0A1F5V9M6_9BACT|nr:MAG: hypothetical protein A2Y62_18500 [Candidatus Fischerbacteria bacterium RBG_13_37_8]
MTDWDKIRKDFPVTKNKTYFLSAAMSPIPIPVFNAILQEYRTLHELGELNFPKDMERFKKLCGDIAELMNTNADNITFVQNTSTAMSLLALSFKNQIKPPFNIISMQDEFPSSTVGFEYLGIKMRYAQPLNARYPIASILDMIDNHTLAVITSQVQYATGFQQNLIALGKELRSRDILFFVNSTQAFPFYPIDVQAAHIDVLTASLHKWGLTGHIGTMFFTTPEFRELFPTPCAGWLSINTKGKSFIHTGKNIPFHLHSTAHCYDSGTFNLQAVLAFQTALDYINQIGITIIQNRIIELTDYLIAGLRKLNITIISPVSESEERSAIVSFTLGNNNKEFIDACAQQHILLSPRDGNIRVSVNIFNNFADIDKLLRCLTPD